ncbi:MAG: DNA translocase FtsK [Clostridium sp.]|nr:DNA translocase FtsK [Prevotella sp.]MCM1428745.1 DNA translocase FtsK [Clostridium sp.]MCM1475120.1 DNA translocase FtsK [Muribaculaceae bacterium]
MNQYDNYNPEIPGVDSYSLPEEGRELPAAESVKKNRKGNDGRSKKSRPASRARMASAKSSASSEPFFRRVKNWAESSTTRYITGIILGGIGAWLLIAFISYFSDCIADQAPIKNSPVGMAPPVANKAGEGGARISELFINEGFGLGSFVIIFWLFAMCLKLLTGRPHFKSVNFTIKCFVALITVSLIVGLVTINATTYVNWGGYHGRYVNQFVQNFLGVWGAFILCVVMIFIFVVICMSDLINWIRRVRAKHAARRRMIAEEKARRLEEQRVIEEMKRQEMQDDVSSGEAYGETVDEPSNPSNGGDTVSFNPVDSNDIYDEYNIDIDDPVNQQRLALKTESSDSQESLDSQYDQEYTESQDSFDSVDSVGSQDSQEPDDSLNNTDEENVTENIEENPASEDDGSQMVVNVNNIASADPSDIDRRSEHYKFPPLEILSVVDDRIAVNAEEQLENKEKIRQTLADFGIPIVSIEATVGPTVTLYEIRPDKGQKVANIKKLVDDISLSLAAIGVRIIAPIPGKGTVGIEVANKNPKMVSMRTVIGSRKYNESKYKLPIALGCTISNDVYIADLTKMPHMLVAGATGQGKSVGLNVIIASLLYRKKPHELKFVMIDPKMVEFSLYSKIEKHYLAKLPGEDKAIITDMTKAVATLNSLVQEMEDRYKLLMSAGCRKVEEYNDKFLSGQLDVREGHRFMPYIVVIIDEFCDLIMSQGKEVEKPIARLAQKARAVGMHEIIATQRPSTTVITGNIKANFLTRVAFKVSSSIDSKTILDATGAQQLIGRGDMLINFNSETTRVQCAFMDTPEVEQLTDWISRQPYGGGAYILPEPMMSADMDGFDEGGFDGTFEKDSKFLEVATHVVQTGYASTSNIQRKFSLGYNRAGKIMDQLEALGVVSPAQGGKPRQVLMSPQEAMEVINNAMQ